MTGQLVDRVRKAGLTRVKAVAKKIATESPRLADLPEEDLEKLARAVVAEGLKDELRKAADLEKVDYKGEREKFVAGRAAPAHSGQSNCTPMPWTSLMLGAGSRASLLSN